MSKDDVSDYEKLKSALLKRYQLTADGFRKRFRTSCPEQGESPVQFITRLENSLVRWVELAGDNKTYDGIKKLFVEEQYLRSCPKEMSMHLREGKPATLKDLELKRTLRLIPLTSCSELTRSFRKCKKRLKQERATGVVLRDILDINVLSLLRRS